jgi:hypothetical protein
MSSESDLPIDDVEDSEVEFVDPAPVTWACLFVAGAFDPNILSELLGVEGRMRRKGDVLGALIAREDSWHFSTPHQHSVDWPSAVEQILVLVRPHAERLRNLQRQYRLQIKLDLCAEMYGDARTPLGWLPPKTIAELANLGAGIDIDLYLGSRGD